MARNSGKVPQIRGAVAPSGGAGVGQAVYLAFSSRQPFAGYISRGSLSQEKTGRINQITIWAGKVAVYGLRPILYRELVKADARSRKITWIHGIDGHY